MFGNKEQFAKMKGFNSDYITYAVIGPDTYSIKDTLKATGFKFTQPMGWHSDKPLEVPEGYSLYQLKFDQCFNEDFEPIDKIKWMLKKLGKGEPIDESPKFPESHFVGEVGERLRNIPARLISTRECKPTLYGVSTCCLFESGGNVFQWFTTSSAYMDYEINDNLLLSGTIKDHSDEYYGGSAITTLTRCLLKPIE